MSTGKYVGLIHFIVSLVPKRIGPGGGTLNHGRLIRIIAPEFCDSSLLEPADFPFRLIRLLLQGFDLGLSPLLVQSRPDAFAFKGVFQLHAQVVDLGVDLFQPV